jgi:hypothetical protein
MNCKKNGGQTNSSAKFTKKASKIKKAPSANFKRPIAVRN